MGMSLHPRAIWVATVAMGLTGVASNVIAAEPSHRCASVVQPAQRLACYDEAFPPPAAVHEAAVQKARDDFGRDVAEQALGNPGQDAEEIDPREIESRISAVAFDNGQRRVTLENGQVWRQTEATTGGHVAVGDAVKLRKGVLSNYFLVTPAGVGLRVRRVR